MEIDKSQGKSSYWSRGLKHVIDPLEEKKGRSLRTSNYEGKEKREEDPFLFLVVGGKGRRTRQGWGDSGPRSSFREREDVVVGDG